MEKHHYKILILIIVLIAAFGIIFISQKIQKTDNKTYTPSIAEAQEEPQLTSVSSPDGKMNLVMNKKKGENTITYTFLLTNEVSGGQKEIFTKTVPKETKLSIPANTFSPDNKYIFLKEESMGQADYFVLTTSGASISKDLQTYDISSSFAIKYPDLTVTDMTGWGGINLIVINTNKANGVKGSSFWFDVPSLSFIQLSNRFD